MNVKKLEVNYICIWSKEKEKSWSGTTFSLYKACTNYLEAHDFGIHYSNLELKMAKLIGKLFKSRQFSFVYSLINNRKIMPKTRKNMKVQLQIGDLVRSESPYYIYQDLCVESIIYFQINDFEAFQSSGFSKISRQAFVNRQKRQKRIYESSNGIFTMSKWLEEFLVEHTGLEKSKVHHVGGGVNVDPRQIDYSIKKSNKILFIGRNFSRKAGRLVVEAFKILKDIYQEDAELYIVGPSSNPLDKNLDGVKFIGEIPKAKLSFYYNLCDVFCMPSYFEAYGIVFIEALVFGLPCIGRNKFAMQEFIQEGENGYLIEDDDPKYLALKMFQCLHDEDMKSNIRMNREAYINQYSWDSVAHRISDIICEEADHTR
jgi:glycosyltransferase involved in cell wall biosynthesis